MLVRGVLGAQISSRRRVLAAGFGPRRLARRARGARLGLGTIVGKRRRTLEHPRHQDLADAPAVGRLNRQPEPVDVDRVARRGHAADAVVHEAADRVVLILVLELEVEVEQLQDLVDVGPAVDARLVVGQPDDHRLLDVVLILDLAHDLLDDVLHRGEAVGAAVFVDHEGKVNVRGLHFGQ
jgi:hypothetical protein